MQAIKILDHNFRLHACKIPSLAPGMRVIETDSISYIDSGLSCDTFNIIHIKDGTSITKTDLNEILNYYRTQKKEYCLWVSQENLTNELKRHFDELELSMTGSETGMIMDLSTYNPVQREQFANIILVNDEQTLSDLAFVIASNWDPIDQNVIRYYKRTTENYLDDQHAIKLFIYYHEGHPAGCLELFPSDAHTVGLYGLATLSKFRGLGIGSTLMTMALNLSKELGYNNVILQATEEGIGIYNKLGFQEITRYYEFA